MIVPPVVAGNWTAQVAVAVPPTAAVTVVTPQNAPSVVPDVASVNEKVIVPVGEVGFDPLIAGVTVATKVTAWVAMLGDIEDVRPTEVAVAPTWRGKATDVDVEKLESPV